jgi:hypothetical protein
MKFSAFRQLQDLTQGSLWQKNTKTSLQEQEMREKVDLDLMARS